MKQLVAVTLLGTGVNLLGLALLGVVLRADAQRSSRNDLLNGGPLSFPRSHRRHSPTYRRGT